MEKVYTYSLKGTPAAVDRREGIIYINPRLFNELTPFEKKFVLLHEEGHYALQTSDEVLCDAYAFDRLAGSEFRSLKQSLGTLDKILDKKNIGRAERIFELYKRVLLWDANKGNKQAAKEYRRVKDMPVLEGVTKCRDREWYEAPWLNGGKKCEYDPAGDAIARAQADALELQNDETRKLSQAFEELARQQKEEKKGQAARDQKTTYFVIVAVIIIFLFWK